MYDIIGDIHGQAEKLKKLLSKLGYIETNNGWQHHQSKAIFVGDFIDREPQQLETLQIVEKMVSNSNAYAVMGNHELNAIGWLTPSSNKSDCNEQSSYLRPHSEKNRKQHRVFLQQMIENSTAHHQWVDWLKKLPLFLEIDGLRIIHACWDNDAIAAIKPYLDKDNCLHPEFISEAFNEDHSLFLLCETLIKGKEITLPADVSYQDKDGIIRRKSRIKWWLNNPKTLRQLCMIPEGQEKYFPDVPVNVDYKPYNAPQCVLFGHYRFTGKPATLEDNIACVDYSAAIANGKLVAYRWSGEKTLSNENFIF